ncbi:hypothetical protein LVD15_18290 [Fulvivirga maritima]|uniref:hypothetical protein n=1 Tax=Fulvivirga maritima TaxID=2904247 RepID=UPI001F33E15F|nr:hypothetical protein [Fulvivirga maritima]UII25244.1 hypothetical protein LVD15_18290 [Fulvivirga maritima]
MKKRLYQLLFFACMGSSVMLTSCDDNDEITPVDPIDDETILVEADEADGSVTESADVSATATDQKVRVHFTSTDGNMRRLYILSNVNGQGDEPFELEDYVENLNTKGDGSIDVSGGESNEFTYEFDLPVPPSGTGTVVYTFWATSGRGDYRDLDKRIVVGPATLTLNYGGTNSQAQLKTYSATILAAPLDDGTSETFMSVLDGDKYALNDTEYTAYWDFGYYYGSTGKASLASTSSYPALFDHDDNANTPLVAIATLTGVDQSELNNFYFAEANSVDFDAPSVSSDLDDLSVSTSSAQRINELSTNDVIAFVDDYGKKGLIKVTSIEGTYSGSITIEVKVQP